MNHLSNMFRHPSQELRILQQSLDRFVDNFFDDSGEVSKKEGSTLCFAPCCDFVETETSYEVKVEMPGLKPENIKVELEDNQLMISGERKENHDKKEGKVHFSEMYSGSFYRLLTLPSNIDPENIQASYHNGILKVSALKSKETKKSLPIKVMDA